MKLRSNGLTEKDFANGYEFLDAHREEALALIEAEEGNREALAQLILDKGFLATHDARVLVVSILKNLPVSVRKRTVEKAAEDVAILGVINNLRNEFSCSEYVAKRKFLETHPDWNAETLKSALKRGKVTIALAKKTGRFMG
jgi:hypothetical protein